LNHTMVVFKALMVRGINQEAFAHAGGINKMKQAIKDFRERAEKFINDEIKRIYEHLGESEHTELTIMWGKKYARLVKSENGGQSKSAWAFIDLSNGDILKPAGWKAPAKHARGNINDEFQGMRRISWTGPHYLK